MKTDDFIDQLGQEATVVRPLPAPGLRTVLWLSWGVLYLVVVAAMLMTAMAAEGVTVTLLYVLQQVAALVTGITAARAAFVSVIPGGQTRVWGLPAASAAAWVALLLWEVALDGASAGTLGVTHQTDWPCVASMVTGGVVLGLPLMWMLRRGAPLTPRATAFLAGLAALSLANIEACLTRPHAFAITVLMWHGATILAIALCFALFGRRWLRWPALVSR